MQNLIRTTFLAAVATILLFAAAPARADEAPDPPKKSNCGGGDASDLGLLVGMATVGFVARRRR